ncbi:LLM class flavin-dependent oxidoreductase [Promicromonospora panici]|uniref:LLM class flavin-dependent oxidoreductase n=1 Tax=Promicromonospora panici TaxID=2219658 RepID=UPI001A919390|nr:LLM class flavin-dependent oxidoreductase [Promicromonospora panici]
MTTIKIGTSLPMAMEALEAPETPPVAEAARQIEELGLESLWPSDLVLGDGTPTLEAALTLATAAAVTTRVRIGFSVLAVPLRPAPWLALQTATLQHLSNDRLLLGVGSGGFPGAPFWQALGVSGRERGRTTDATLRLLPRLLSGEPVRISEEAPPLTMAPSATMPPVLVAPYWADPRWVDPRWVDPRWADPRWADPRWADRRGTPGGGLSDARA